MVSIRVSVFIEYHKCADYESLISASGMFDFATRKAQEFLNVFIDSIAVTIAIQLQLQC